MTDATSPPTPAHPFPETGGVHLTERAAEHVRAYLARQGATAFRVRITRAGCSGFGYAVEAAPAPEATDRAFESHGVQVVVDAESLPLLEGLIIDYVREGLNGTFKYQNPKAVATCGCGTSFSVASP